MCLSVQSMTRIGSRQKVDGTVTAVLCGDLGGTNSRLILYAAGDLLAAVERGVRARYPFP
jgi:hypothetical protein